jgi:hypothetical protein
MAHPAAPPLLLRVGDHEELTRLVRASSVRRDGPAGSDRVVGLRRAAQRRDRRSGWGIAADGECVAVRLLD